MTTNTLKFFTLLRFPLMVGVVMIHCDISDQLVPELRGQWAQDVMYFFSNIIGRFSVPMFFLISGFLFYRNGTLTHNEYASKLHHRLYTLLIPYLHSEALPPPYVPFFKESRKFQFRLKIF